MISVLLLSLASALFAAPQPPALRLPADVAPVRYRLDLTLDPAREDFAGKVEIDLKVNKAASVLWLNAAKLKISKATLEQNGSRVSAATVPGGDSYVGFELASAVQPGDAVLRLEYTGPVNLTASAGVFLSKRNDDRYLFTQFEPLDARAAFPCFDEPSFKVPWKLTLHIPAAHSAVSNTPIESETVEGATKRVVFRETQPLPSYLVAFGVGPFEFVDGGVAGRNKAPVRIVVPHGDAPRARYAAQVTAEILTRLEEYFGIPYPFEKADQLAIPLSFGGAMENAGLVTYDAGIILAPPQGEDTLQRQRGYASVAAHELAHQWFGDLVTMAWWNDLWLNESFATFIEQKLIAAWKPEWNTRVDDQGNRTYAMWLDRLATARRIDQPILDKSDIANAFDGITYQKGASVLNMAENAMGEEHFRLAVRSYLEHHARANATARDFLDALGQAAGPAAPASFRTFLEQPGVPEVSMQLKCESGKVQVDMQQRRFVPLGGATSDGQSWKVPVCVSYGMPDGLRSRCTTLEERTGSLTLETSSCPAFFYGNSKAKGYYYTRYEAPALRALVQNRSQLSLAERAGLFGELDNLAKTGVLPVSEGLKLAVDLKDDAARQVTQAALEFASIRLEFLPRELRPRYAAYVRETFGARARALGWTPKPGESDEDRLLRPSIVGFVAGDGEDKELIAQATALAAKWLDSRQALPAETFGEVFRIAARNGDAALHERIVAAAKAEKDEFFEGRLIGALGDFRSPSLVQRNFDLLLQGTFDMRHAFGLVFGPLNDPDLSRLPLEFVMARYDALVARLPNGVGSDYAAYLPQTAGRGCSAEAAREAEVFFKPRMANVNGGPRNLAQTLEAIRLCEARKATQQADLTQFFQSR